MRYGKGFAYHRITAELPPGLAGCKMFTKLIEFFKQYFLTIYLFNVKINGKNYLYRLFLFCFGVV